MKNNPGFFDFAAEVGLTKYIGGLDATEELIRLCSIGKGSWSVLNPCDLNPLLERIKRSNPGDYGR